MTRLSKLKMLQREKMNVANAARPTRQNLIDLSSSEEDKSINSDESDNSDDDFAEDNNELDDNKETNSIINRLLMASAASFKNNKCTIYTGLSTWTCQRKNKVLKNAAVGSLKITSFFYANSQLLATDNMSTEDSNSISDIMHEEMLSKMEQACYIAVLYFLRLLLKGKEKMEASKTVAEFVSFQFGAYLRSQKFEVTPEMVKKYFEEQILLQLNIRSVQGISVRTAHGHERPDIVAYYQLFLEEVVQLDRFISKWLNQDCKIRTFSQLSDKGEQPLRKKGLDPSVHISDFIAETKEPLKDDHDEACDIIVLGAN
ncbi:27268_t:CDS:2 [Gigaspora margarita]|uniref:27268_t:CDS:1 n=1 Tax=Gigaspora margarita TaxID=4874 RepID=A0ABN7VC37_GIGMA|nr:27268_t:CDS:2 [Gigaspora margarita]